VTHDYRPPPEWLSSRGRWETCRDCGKRSYQNRRDARRVRRLQVAEYGEKLSELQIYRCRRGNSGAFHLGHGSPDLTETEEEAS